MVVVIILEEEHILNRKHLDYERMKMIPTGSWKWHLPEMVKFVYLDLGQKEESTERSEIVVLQVNALKIQEQIGRS